MNSGEGEDAPVATRVCSLCGERYRAEGAPYAPFCSRRCQLRDLGNWLDERYGLPYEDPAGESTLDDGAEEEF